MQLYNNTEKIIKRFFCKNLFIWWFLIKKYFKLYIKYKRYMV
jgi:hypothetical protein